MGIAKAMSARDLRDEDTTDRGLWKLGLSRPKSDESNGLQEISEDLDLEPMIINRGPFFDKNASKNVTALVDKTSYLNCKVRNLGNRTKLNFAEHDVMYKNLRGKFINMMEDLHHAES
ncbi:hypothetical protein FQR65_LT00660 [Abscondita terminalis]|nr:hypothetical protein FQR65_LT00660 [Abscondita terminalis]